VELIAGAAKGGERAVGVRQVVVDAALDLRARPLTAGPVDGMRGAERLAIAVEVGLEDAPNVVQDRGAVGVGRRRSAGDVGTAAGGQRRDEEDGAERRRDWGGHRSLLFATRATRRPQ
jgi:hypothetical protein